MQRARWRLVVLVTLSAAAAAGAQAGSHAGGVLLEDLSWVEAEKVLTPEAVVVIPLGAAAKEHGPHLPLSADWLIAEYFKRELLKRSDVVMAPTITYYYYPPFAEYPGSTTLSLETARGLLVDVCRSLARYGPRRFYVINVGLATLPALQAAVDQLAKESITVRYLEFAKAILPAKEIIEQEGGSHADEVETSLLLYMVPDRVDMSKAVKDFRPRKGYPTRDPNNTEGTYLPSGVYGDATLATSAKGRRFTETLLEDMLRSIAELRSSGAPAPAPAAP
ncbi:MAG: creatininase family protein [Thermoanaerobaculia bacterium]|nr:MAG: creatininase family protein [Thermoanaerobaculia bacterium]